MEEKSLSTRIAAQATPILITAGIAAGIGFIQSLAASVGACPSAAMDPVETGAIGAILKTAHSAIKSIA